MEPLQKNVEHSSGLSEEEETRTTLTSNVSNDSDQSMSENENEQNNSLSDGTYNHTDDSNGGFDIYIYIWVPPVVMNVKVYILCWWK